MVHRNEVIGRIYTFNPNMTAAEKNKIPPHIRRRFVLVLDTVPGREGYVKILGITPYVSPSYTYIPIAPTPKSTYPMQLLLRKNYTFSQLKHGEFVNVKAPGNPELYVRVDESFEVEVGVLVGVRDKMGDDVAVRRRKRRGMGEFGMWLKGWEREKARKVEDRRGDVVGEKLEGDEVEEAGSVEVEDGEVGAKHPVLFSLWAMMMGMLYWILEEVGSRIKIYVRSERV
ncbi:hypothetical protein VTL71DRAFT_5510 [Oculimacula yallundae]|uniref:Uncharacterized protein n=1 Tax=Oculimacula yallundae TaxID=86028 RepID=A0ABR4C1B4_9HELO